MEDIVVLLEDVKFYLYSFSLIPVIITVICTLGFVFLLDT